MYSNSCNVIIMSYIFGAVSSIEQLPLAAFDECNSEQDLNINNVFSSAGCEITLNENSDLILNLNIYLTDTKNSVLYTPTITTTTISSENEVFNQTGNSMIDIVVYPNHGSPIIWSHKRDFNGRSVTKIVYIPEINLLEYNNRQKLKLILSNKLQAKIRFSIEIKLKDINIGVMTSDVNKTAIISHGSLSIWRFQNNKPNQRRHIRVHTTWFMEVCSIVTIQPLNEPLLDQENNVAYGGRWQTMLKSSVIDVDIGANDNSYQTKYKDGFFIVILQKTNPKDCKISDYQSRKYGRRNSVAENTKSSGYSSETRKTIFIRVTEIQDPSVYISLIVIVSYVVLLVLTAFVGVLFNSYVPVVGTVLQTKASCRFGKLDEIFLVFKKIQAIVGIDTVDLNSKNHGSIIEGEEVDHVLIDIIYSNKDGQQNETTDDHEIEMKDTSSNPLVISNENDITNAPHDREDSKDIMEKSQLPSNSNSRVGLIKKALNIRDADDVRIVSTIRQRKLVEKRRNCEPKLVNMATICDTTLFPNARRLRSKLYTWTLSIIGIFYIIPSIQLMLAAQNITYETGTEDVCYYNYLCRYHGYGLFGIWFEDYGHVFSNVSYIFCGIHFIILVYLRQRERRKAMINLYLEKQKSKESKTCVPPKQNSNENASRTIHLAKKISQTIVDSISYEDPAELPDKFKHRNVEFLNRCGIPEQYGIFYAMGGALICEGILSACYHICPVNESFQFDTTFMYIIAILMFLKVYQFRHPDLTARAYTIFLMVAITLIFEAIGYYWIYTPGVFLILFILTYLAFTMVFMNAMLFQGDRDWKKKLEAIKINKEGVQVYFIVTLITNVSLAIFMLVKSFSNSSIVSNYLLIIFMLNMTLYIFYYVLMKNYHVYWCHRKWESLSFTCCFYLFLSALCGGIGLYFFGIQEKSTLVSPAESRHLNDECTIWFFDKHDIWHFASAFGLLFSFLSLLTMEDNNTATPWENIPVF